MVVVTLEFAALNSNASLLNEFPANACPDQLLAPQAFGRVAVTFIVQEQASNAPADRAGRVDERLALASPMPATVVDVRVGAGDRVSRGDVMIVLEAMKMELPIVAPRDATVGAVRCRPGELVQPGVPLLTLE